MNPIVQNGPYCYCTFLFLFLIFLFCFMGFFPLSRLFMGHGDGFVRSSETQRTRARRGRKGVRCAIHARRPKKTWRMRGQRVAAKFGCQSAAQSPHFVERKEKKRTLKLLTFPLQLLVFGKSFFQYRFRKKSRSPVSGFGSVHGRSLSHCPVVYVLHFIFYFFIFYSVNGNLIVFFL